MDLDRMARRWAPTHSRLRADTPMPAAPSTNAPAEQTNAPADPSTGSRGVMVAFFLDDDDADALELCNCDDDCACSSCPDCPDIPAGLDPEDDDELHLTLAYLGQIGENFDASKEPDLVRVVSQWALAQREFEAQVSGLGLFDTPDGPVTYASVSAAGLPEMRQQLVKALAAAGFPLSNDLGFTPHITLCYGDCRGIDVPNMPVQFETVSVVVAGRRTDIPLADDPAFVDDEDDSNSTDEITPLYVGASDNRVTSARQCKVKESAAVPREWSFVTTVGKRTVVTTSASLTPSWASPLTPNQHMLWTQGRLVGAEEPNRNGAYWSSGDLEMGLPTVAHGPLNWLHQERHIIGSIADARFMPRRQMQETAADTSIPHIMIAAGIWKWIFPQEASVVEMASAAGVAAISMECISENVACAGPGGCGKEVSYLDFLQGYTCSHLFERGAIRRFVNPTFLGAAVIVPPSEPGWADADMRVIASAQAEGAYDQAGRPEITANKWEQIVAGAVTYAHRLNQRT